MLSKVGAPASAPLIRRRWPQLLGALAVFVLGSDRAAAQLMVYPTRLVLEQFEVPYSSLHNAEVIAGDLRDRYDCIVLPAVSLGFDLCRISLVP